MRTISPVDDAYRDLVQTILSHGEVHENRTGVNTRRIWGHMTRLDLSKGFPLLTQKKMHVRSAFIEMLGFVRGETNVRWYQDRDCRIWNADHARWHGKDLDKDCNEVFFLGGGYNISAEKIEHRRKLLKSVEMRRESPDTLGNIYGKQWRNFGGYDQLNEIITALKAGSNSRRLIMSAWAPHELHLMALPPCHIAYHFVKRGEFVDVAMWQRSCDTALGVPYNWANTALLTHLVAHATNLKPGKMVWFGDDVHIYEPHIDGLAQQLNQDQYPPPALRINKPAGTMPWDIEFEDLEVIGYEHSGNIKFELFVG